MTPATVAHVMEWMHWVYRATKFDAIFIASTTRRCQLLSSCSCSANTRCRRRLDIANERLPEFNLPASFPSVAVPSMRRAHRPWGSGNTTPTGEHDLSHELPPGAGADVPGGWPVVPSEDLGRRRGGEGGEDRRLVEQRVPHGRRAPGS